MSKLVAMVLIVASAVTAQSEMTVEDAIILGLKNNYDIRIARNVARVAENNKGKGKAGFLPTADASGNYQLSKTDQDSNSPFSFGDSDTKSWGAQVSLNWTVFDGFRMFADKKRFDEMARLGEYQAQDIIENSVVGISRAYFNLVQQEQLLEVARRSRDISRDRLDKEQVRKEIGGASSTDFLNAQVAFNNDRSILLAQELEVVVANKELNVVLGQDAATPITVSKVITPPQLAHDYDSLLAKAMERNSNLNIARQNEAVARMNSAIKRSPYLPRLLFNASYGYTDQTVSSEAQSFEDDISTQSKTGSVGLTLSFNLFNGGRDQIEWQNSRIELENRELALRDATNRLAGLVRERYETLRQRLELVSLEEQNQQAAEQNLALQQDRYRLGATSSLEFRDAQVNLVRAQTALIVARYQARIAGLEIEQLTGDLTIE